MIPGSPDSLIRLIRVFAESPNHKDEEEEYDKEDDGCTRSKQKTKSLVEERVLLLHGG